MYLQGIYEIMHGGDLIYILIERKPRGAVFGAEEPFGAGSSEYSERKKLHNGRTY